MDPGEDGIGDQRRGNAIQDVGSQRQRAAFHGFSCERRAALINRRRRVASFMVTASGLTLFSIGSAFWGIVAGVLTLVILNYRKP